MTYYYSSLFKLLNFNNGSLFVYFVYRTYYTFIAYFIIADRRLNEHKKMKERSACEHLTALDILNIIN